LRACTADLDILHLCCKWCSCDCNCDWNCDCNCNYIPKACTLHSLHGVESRRDWSRPCRAKRLQLFGYGRTRTIGAFSSPCSLRKTHGTSARTSTHDRRNRCKRISHLFLSSSLACWLACRESVKGLSSPLSLALRCCDWFALATWTDRRSLTSRVNKRDLPVTHCACPSLEDRVCPGSHS